MNRVIEFLKTTALGRFFSLLPILLLCLMLREVFELIVALAMPIADLFPRGTFDQANFPVLMALLLLFGVSFALGLAPSSGLGERFSRAVEGRTLNRVPLYRTLKGLAWALPRSAGTVGSSQHA